MMRNSNSDNEHNDIEHDNYVTDNNDNGSSDDDNRNNVIINNYNYNNDDIDNNSNNEYNLDLNQIYIRMINLMLQTSFLSSK